MHDRGVGGVHRGFIYQGQNIRAPTKNRAPRAEQRRIVELLTLEDIPRNHRVGGPRSTPDERTAAASTLAEALEAIGLWAPALILWGLIRLGMIGLFTWGPISEAHVQGQFTIAYVIISLGTVALGVYLFRSRRQIPTSVVRRT